MATNQNSDETNQAIIHRYMAAENERDIEALMDVIHEEIVFEDTTPPSGNRFSGSAAFRAFMVEVFEPSPNLRVELEDLLISGDRAVVAYRYTWLDKASEDDPGFVRGIALFRFRDGKVIEMFPYVKG